MKTKTSLWIYIICSVLAVASIGAILFAWYTNTQTTTPVTTITSGIQITYDIKDLNNNTITFETTETITFYDADSTDELADFNSSINAKDITAFKITLKNTGDTDVTYSIQNIIADNTSPYVACLFSATELTSATYTSGSFPTCIADLYSGTGLGIYNAYSGDLNKYSSGTVDSDTIYIYLFGVQPNDDTDNDFLSETYTFTLKVNSVQKGGE